MSGKRKQPGLYAFSKKDKLEVEDETLPTQIGKQYFLFFNNFYGVIMKILLEL